jgi:hypothetical protein
MHFLDANRRNALKVLDILYPMVAIAASAPKFNNELIFRSFVYSAASFYTFLRASGRLR